MASNSVVELSSKIGRSVKMLQDITDPDVIKEVVSRLMDNSLFKDSLLSCLGIPDLHKKIASLETRIDDMEQYSRRTCLKFRGIPELEGENTDELIVDACNNTLGIMVSSADISRSHRVGPKTKSYSRDIIVRFVSYNIRAQVYDARFSLFSKKNESSTSSNRSLSDSTSMSKPVSLYINEALTKQRSAVFTKARYLKKSGLISGTWTYDGRIVIRELGGDKQQVTSLDELSQYPDPPPQSKKPQPRTLDQKKASQVTQEAKRRKLAPNTSTPGPSSANQNPFAPLATGPTDQSQSHTD